MVLYLKRDMNILFGAKKGKGVSKIKIIAINICAKFRIDALSDLTRITINMKLILAQNRHG